MAGKLIEIADYPVIDGFTLRTDFKCDLTFEALAAGSKYKPLRRAGAFRPKIVTVPEDANAIAIPARDAYEYQVQVTPGTAFWAFTFIAASGLFSAQVTDACSGVPLFAEPVLSSGAAPEQQLLPDLFIISAPGRIFVEIMSLQATDTKNVQFILWGGEPLYP